MAKSRKTDKVRHLENRGTGLGKHYKPWLNVVEVPSLGRSHRHLGIKTRRMQVFLSDLEEYYFLLLEWNDKVKDIREQFPLLPKEQTEHIAKKLGYKHPQNPKTKENVVMTTDFLLTVSDGKLIKNIAIAVKTMNEVKSSARIREKLKIEETYWKNKGVDWGVITDEAIDIQKAKNLKLLKPSYYQIAENIILRQNVNPLQVYLKMAKSPDWVQLCLHFDNLKKLPHGSSLNIAKYIIWSKGIAVDLSKPLDFTNVRIIKEVSGCG